MNPVIVVGIRSGTSAVARVLQTELGITMDDGPIKKDWRNANGYYEDRRLQEINKMALRHCLPQVGKLKEVKVPVEWVSAFVAWCSKRESNYPGSWGFKDPTSVGLIRYMHQFFIKPKWIVPVKPFQAIVRSCMDKLNMTQDMAIATVKSYNFIINREIGNKASYIDMSYYRKTRDLKIILGELLHGC